VSEDAAPTVCQVDHVDGWHCTLDVGHQGPHIANGSQMRHGSSGKPVIWRQPSEVA
jgi:hypothetical protein